MEIYEETKKIQRELEEIGIEISLEGLQEILMTKFEEENPDCPDCVQLAGGVCFKCLIKAIVPPDAPSADDLYKALEDPEA